MKISEMIKNLYAFMDEHGDVDCWYAVDNEGNNFCPVYFKPSFMYIDSYEIVYNPEDFEDMQDEDTPLLTKICVVN